MVRRSAFMILTGCVSLLYGVAASIWTLDNEYDMGQNPITWSELYMYSNDNAPLSINNDPARINVDLHLDMTSMYGTRNLTVVVSVFHVPPRFVSDPVNTEILTSMLSDTAKKAELCQGKMPHPASHIRTRTFRSVLVGPGDRYYAHARMQYKVKQSGLHSVILEVCSSEADWGVLDTATKVKGTIEFRNPYGYLPGIFFGYLPFEGSRALLFFVFALIYIFFLCGNRSSIMIVHYSVMVVVVVAFAEATAWFIAYEGMNASGQPYCCPFPKTVVIAMLLKMLRRSLSRTLLLVLCMGYGITRDSLTKREILSVIILSVSYLTASATVDVHDLVEINDLHRTVPHSIG